MTPKIIHILAIQCLAVATIASAQTTQTPGTWVNVIAPMADEYASTVLIDPVRKSDMWVFRENYQGCWKSTDFGTTWFKVSAKGGVSGNGITGHGAWYAAIDKDPNRDPATSPALYVTQGYDALGIWKSTDGGVTWFDVWNNNIYAPDGVTNIYCDVGRDIMAILAVDPAEPQHLIADLHSIHDGYSGCGTDNNNGIFETFDAGGKWIVHRSIASYTTFTPHGDMLFSLDKSTWCVSSGSSIFRSTDAGTSWTTAAGSVGPSTGIQYCNRKVGNTWYVATDHTGPLAKTTDMGASWTTIAAPGNQVEWVLATEKNLYVANGSDQSQPQLYQASINDDATWKAIPTPMPKGGHDADVTFDGTHYIIIYPAHAAGVWRYVEQEQNTGIALANPLATPTAVFDNATTPVTFSIDASASGGISGVTIDLSPIGGAAAVAMTKGSGNTYTVAFTVQPGAAAGNKTLAIAATNSAGNTLYGSISLAVLFHDAPVLISSGKNVVVSSTQDATTPGSAAVDGDMSTRWSSAASDPQWIYIDLGSVTAVNQVVLKWETAYGKSYQIQVSTDATTWTNVFTTTTGDGGTDSITFAATNARYVRMYGTQRGTAYGYSLYEFEVYGPAPGATTSHKMDTAKVTAHANRPAMIFTGNIRSNACFYDVKGQRISSNKIGLQAVIRK